MNAQEVLKILEVDLTDSNITVGMTPIKTDNDRQRFSYYFGFLGVSSPQYLKNTVRKHLESGQNYLIFLDNFVRIDSQLEYKGKSSTQRKSIYFYFILNKQNSDNIFLIPHGAGYSTDYGKRERINFKDVDGIVIKYNLSYFPIPPDISEIDRIEKFKGIKPSYETVFGKRETIPIQLKSSVIEEPQMPMVQPKTKPLTQDIYSPPEEKWLALEGVNLHVPVDIYHRVYPPKIKWIALTNYDLSNIDKNFLIGDFEREVNPHHIREVLESIMTNQLWDNVIKVVQLGPKKFGVIDAQHRLIALKKAHALGVERYNLMLAVYPPEHARNIYRKVNLGRKLTVRDHVKAMDDGTVTFFNELRKKLLHYPKDGIGFVDMLSAFIHADTDYSWPKLTDFEKNIYKITKKETDSMNIFLETMEKTVGLNKRNNPLCKPIPFRSIFSVYFGMKLSPEKLAEMLQHLKDDPRFAEISKSSGNRKVDYIAARKVISEHLKKLFDSDGVAGI